MDILNAGITEAKYAAKYQTAEALQYRAKEDAKLLADQANQIRMMQLQAKMEFDTWKKQQDYLQKTEDASQGALQGLNVTTTTAASASADFRTWLVDDPELTADELVAKYQETNGSLGENERLVLTAVARSVKGSVNSAGKTVKGYSTEDEAREVVDALLLLYPNFGGERDRILKTITSQLKAGYSAAEVEAAARTNIERGQDNLIPSDVTQWDQEGRTFKREGDQLYVYSGFAGWVEVDSVEEALA
jgi:hypothetical protein